MNRITKMSLDWQIQNLTIPSLIAWLDYVPNDLVIRGCEDIVRAMLSVDDALPSCEKGDFADTDWIIAHEICTGENDIALRLKVDGERIIIVDIGKMGTPVVWSAWLPSYVVKVGIIAELMSELRDRPIYGYELREVMNVIFAGCGGYIEYS